ncbi:MAG: class I SAM-dependent methyltransferase [Microcoleaceae cyanobacterium]
MSPPQIDIGYIPTPLDAVCVALELAEIAEQDILYDLGCGDGRVVVTAAQRFGAQAVGIDIDPVRIQTALENGKKAGVSHQVRFYQQNLFECEFGEATVVFLYLLPHLNLRLKPKLLEQLKPGSRIISRDFDFGEWQPEKTIYLPNGEEECTLLRWTIPK